MIIEIKKNHWIICMLLFLLGRLHGLGQTLDVSIRTIGPGNHIEIVAVANGNFQASNGTDDWSSGGLFMRIDPNAVPIQLGNPSPDPTNEDNTGFAPFPVENIFVGGTDLLVFSLDQVGGTDDGYYYMYLLYDLGVINVPLSNGSEVVLFSFDLPSNWQCNDCVELIKGIVNIAGYDYGTFLNNNGVGGDVINIVDAQTSLPIELTRFESRVDKCDLSLHWETATEQNLGYYQVESSKDGRDFAVIGQVKPRSPNSLEKRAYNYPIASKYYDQYYRLKAVDLDGAFEYSPVIFAKAPCEQKQYAVELYPNPNYASGLTVEIDSPQEKQGVALYVLDAFGKQLSRQKVNVGIGSNKILVETDNLPTGTYFIKIIGIDQLNQPLKFIRSNF